MPRGCAPNRVDRCFAAVLGLERSQLLRPAATGPRSACSTILPLTRAPPLSTPNDSARHAVPGWKSAGTGLRASTVGPAPLTTAATPTERSAATREAVPGIATAR